MTRVRVFTTVMRHISQGKKEMQLKRRTGNLPTRHTVTCHTALAQLLSGTTIARLLALGAMLYTGQSALAGTCTTGPISVCSGPASGSDATQSISNSGPVSVTTEPGFGLSVTGTTDGIDIYGQNGASFIDDNHSAITSGGMFGIYGSNDVGGNLNIISTGSVTSTSATGDGIRGFSYGANMLISAHDTQGGNNGINATNYGTGSVHVVSTGSAVGGGTNGIYAYAVSGTDMTVDAVDTQGVEQGIYAHGGSGALSITSTGLATGTDGDGIRADGFGTDITVNAADTHGAGGAGIMVSNSGTGAIRINSTGTANGESAGIIAYNDSGTGTTIDAVDTNGAYGIGVSSNGGPITVTSTGTASGTSWSGISVASYGMGDVSISAKDTRGGLYGIYFLGAGAGNVDISSNGTAAGGDLDGIYAETGSLGTALNITVNDAQGGRNGVYTVNGSAAGTVGNTATIDVAGHVLGGSGYGIATESGAGVLTAINVGSNAVVESTSGNAISNNEGDSHVLINPGAVVNGAINLGSGNDTLDLPAGLSGITVLDGGGGGVDTLNLANAAEATHAGSDIRNWSAINIDNSYLTLTGGSLAVGTPGDLTTGVFLHNGSTLDGRQDDFALNGNLSLDSGTTFLASANGTGANTVSGTVTNAGYISLAGQGAGDRLTVGGNFVGKGGVIAIDTVLGNDASATDKVAIKGDTAGTSVVKVANAGGQGAATAEGIEVVSVGGASNGVFSLSGDYQFNGKPAVVAGAYAYQLYKGNRSGTETSNWYLRSELNASSDDASDTKPSPTASKPLYQPGVPTYEAYPQALLALNSVSTLQQRLGNRFWSGAGAQGTTGSASAAKSPHAATGNADTYTDGNGAWGRIDAGNSRNNFADSTSGTGLDQNFSKVQVGADAVLARHESGALIAGGYFQYVHGDTATHSVYGDGDISTDGYGLGGTLTWYGKNGYYVDGQAQIMRFKSDLSSSMASRSLINGNHATGYALSVESGKRIPINAQWSITPQAQLTYTRADFDNFNDPFGAAVSSNKGASLQSRLGITLDHEAQGGKGSMSRSHIYGIANLYYEFLNGSQVTVSGKNFSSRPDRLWGGLGAGVSYNWGKDKYSLYAEGLVNTSLEKIGSSRSLQGNVGFRMRW